MNRALSFAGWCFLALIYLFIVGPLAFIGVASINRAAAFPSSFEGLTLRWYRAIFDHPEFIDAAWTSALIAAISSALATVAALLAGYAMRRGRKREDPFLTTLLSAPILVPQIVLSLAMLQFAGLFGLGAGFTSLTIVHAVYGLPFALRLVLTGMARFDFSLEEASLNLGAGRLRTWFDVILPLLRPSLIAGFTFCFILSFVNLPISLFLTDARTTTLPIVMFAYIEAKMDPTLAAVATLVILIACAATLAIEQRWRVRLVD